MKVLTVAQQKGGVGKSTLAIHLAAEAVRDGMRASIIELDRQGTATLWSVQRTAGAEVSGKPPEVMKIESSQLGQHMKALKSFGVKLLVLDLPGAHSAAISPAIKAADFVLVPSRPHEVDITASADTLATVQRLSKPYAYILTFVEPTGGRAKDAREALEEAGHEVAPVDIGRRQIFADVVASGETAGEKEPKGKAASEIRHLWAWIKIKLEIESDGPEARA